MKIVFVQGGLGNQLFQYAFFKYLIKKGNKHVYLDGTAPFISKHGGFELPRIFPAIAANTLVLPYWKARVPYLLCDVLKKIFKIDLQTNVENPTRRKIWWKAHWQEYKYAEYVREELLNDFQFIPITDEKNATVLSQIKASNAVSIHVRRGDYNAPRFRPETGDICTVDYYRNAIDYIEQKVTNPCFFVFSDDPQWVKTNLPIANAICIDWNHKKNSFRDMQLMSHCQHHIIANSSFSWWGAWLNPSEKKIIVCPKKWFHSFPKDFIEKLVPPSWHRVGQVNPNVTLIAEELTEQEATWILQQSYKDFELLTNSSLKILDERVNSATEKSTGNHTFPISKDELSLFKKKKYLHKKLVNYFTVWNNQD